jgi:hypothetical protein
MRDRVKRRKFNRNYKSSFQLNKLSVGLIGVCCLLFLGLFYLAQANKMATKGYDIASLEKQRQALAAENERLMIESSRLQSIQEIEVGVKDSGLVPVKKINYVPYSTSVALNVQQ